MKFNLIAVLTALLAAPISANAWIPSTSKLTPEIWVTTTKPEVTAVESTRSVGLTREPKTGPTVSFLVTETTPVRIRR